MHKLEKGGGGYLSLFVMITVGVLCANVLIDALLLRVVSKDGRHLFQRQSLRFGEPDFRSVSL